jgi:hypothetical protein
MRLFYWQAKRLDPPGRAVEWPLTWWDYLMFHGEEWPEYRKYRSDLPDRPILRLWRNVYRVPRVFFPSAVMVVEATVGEALARLGVRVQPVEFTQCFSLPYGEPGSEPPPEEVWPWSSEFWPEALDRLPKLAPPESAYVEVLERRLKDIDVVGGVEIDVSAYDQFGTPMSPRGRVSEESLARHPITWINGGFLLSEPADAILAPHFDPHQLRRFELKV